MSEIKAIRLGAAATTYNVGKDHIVEELQKSGFTVENNPSAKLTVEMVMALEKAFNKDKAIKAQADNTKMVEKPKKETLELKEEIPITAARKQEDEKIVQIKSNIVSKEKEATPAPTAKVEEPAVDKFEAEAPKLDGPKIVGKVDLTKPKKTTKKAEEPKVEEQPVAKVEPQPDVVAETPVETPAEPAVDENFIQRKTVTLEGPKIMGKIELKPDKSELPAKRKEDTGPNGEKRVRKRIEKPKRTPVQGGGPGQGGHGGHGPGGRGGDRRPGDRGPRDPNQVVEISEKEIEEKIRATMSKIQNMTSKSDRSKFRRDKREAIQERMEAERANQENGKLKVTEFMTAAELASLMNIPAVKIIQTCMQLGIMVSINQRLDAEIIELVAGENGFEVEFQSIEDQTAFEEEEADRPEDLSPRAPIVTIMGHVDHGKTSLLDFIRKANVVAKEAGGITQHIGAYQVTTGSGREITFLDTPGHEAFTAMRARGAKVTDVAVIVIAADDAVMPQTREAINHAQAAGVPMIFAFNKIDKDGANAEKIREQLSQMNILVEEWGGKFQSQEISAKKGLNVDLLLDKILIESDLLDLKANDHKGGTGTIIEATLDKGRGYTATLLVQSGTLNKGDIIVCGPYYGRIKAMFDHKGERIDAAGPSTPVQVLGLNGAPQAGEVFKVFANEQDAKDLATKRAQLIRETGIRTKKHITLDEIGRRLALGNFKELNLIIKGDVDGSVEALGDSLLKLSTEEIQVRIIHKGVGQISESDVNLATAADAIILGFNVRPSQNAKKIAETENIEIKLYSVIYQAINDVKSAMEGLMEPKIEEKIIGNLDVKEVFNVSKVGTIAGCFVRDGKILRNSKVRLIRDGIVIHTGQLSGLKRFKDDAKEATSGMECGLQIKDFSDIQVGDNIEAFEQVEIAAKL
ncbi:MAG: translation initiation factor IF-2 [Bacteroidetes bacterium]|nr:translation initiation factor IF-2 [Bacteroidota bacterium]